MHGLVVHKLVKGFLLESLLLLLLGKLLWVLTVAPLAEPTGQLAKLPDLGRPLCPHFTAFLGLHSCQLIFELMCHILMQLSPDLEPGQKLSIARSLSNNSPILVATGLGNGCGRPDVC